MYPEERDVISWAVGIKAGTLNTKHLHIAD